MYENRRYEKWREYMPRYENGRRIDNEEMYRDAVNNLRWENRKGNGEKWQMDDIMRRTDVNFDREQFTPYDYAYEVNAHYSDYPDISDKPDKYMQMAEQYLRNDNFPERGYERAYYDYQNRRRYRNEYNPYNYRNSRRDRDNDGRYNE